MRIVVLGKSPSWQDAGGACSGYLVEGGGATVLLDCGPGVFAKLRQHAEYERVDAIVLSHLHADHVLDLVTYASALRYGPREGRPRLYAPPGAREQLALLCRGGAMAEDHVELAFELTIYDPAQRLEIGELGLRFAPVPHFITCNAIEVDEGAARLTFSADCGPNDALVDFARDTELLLAEATIREPAAGHLTPRQAGEHAARARARSLVLTHISDELDADAALAEAAAAYDGPVEIAREGAVYTVAALAR